MTLDTRSKTYSICLDVGNFLRREKFPDAYRNMFARDGVSLPPEEANTFLVLEQAKGHKVIPFSAGCGKPCDHADNGCTGFDYTGGGCPGHYTQPTEENHDQ